ncbi:hypothetical protein [Caldilinea sp.]|uniref:hypothetical protein n=1 Tax=Caldilinea sp. TaxID=2293560 RepID=UPI002CECFE7C|nr:hypothetical protein [Anaerolineales bacterium]HQY90641.1 hypothetical protein [Caldilinea sp.]
MTETFWWCVLAGFLLGFSVSTLWEWIYFRRRRMTIRDRRIAELQATVRTYTAATTTATNSTVEHDWAEPAFQNPGVYLETEEAPPATVSQPVAVPKPAAVPQPMNASQPARSAAFVSPAANGAHAPAGQPVNPPPSPVVAQASPAAPPAGFQSVAVHQPLSPTGGAPQAVALPATRLVNQAQNLSDAVNRPSQPPITQPSSLPEALAALSAASSVHHVEAAPADAEQESAAADAASTDATDAATAAAATSRAAPLPAYTNGYGDSLQADQAQAPNLPPRPATPAQSVNLPQADQSQKAVEALSQPAGASAHAGAAARGEGNQAITSTKIDALVLSINELIDTVSQETNPDSSGASAPLPHEPKSLGKGERAGEARDSVYTTRITGRTEYVLVRLVQSMVQFVRQVRTILTGADAARPALRAEHELSAGDDLTRINGLNADHAERLRTAGVITYAKLAQLSTDELRLITLTPNGVATNYAEWRVAATQLAADGQEGRH